MLHRHSENLAVWELDASAVPGRMSPSARSLDELRKGKSSIASRMSEELARRRADGNCYSD
jgi:hypothetical protein